MDERGRQQLQLKLDNKESSLQFELDTLRNRITQETLGNDLFDPEYFVRSNLEFVAHWLEDFTRFSFETAKSISSERLSFELAAARIELMLQRFGPNVRVYCSRLDRAAARGVIKSQNEEAIRRVQRAFTIVDELYAEAELDFQPERSTDTEQPKVEDLDEWIRSCGTNNSKKGWELIKRQAELRRPKFAFFMERWRTVSNRRKRGRPPKLKSTKP